MGQLHPIGFSDTCQPWTLKILDPFSDTHSTLLSQPAAVQHTAPNYTTCLCYLNTELPPKMGERPFLDTRIEVAEAAQNCSSVRYNLSKPNWGGGAPAAP
jgi:hypothetical protein